ncbi:MAG: carbamoyltransferase HypF [Dissulfurispiraceae bacterium]
MTHLHIVVKGIVQGVGFRPFVYNLAKKLKLNGYVTNSSEGVVIEVEGNRPEIFVESLKREHPPLAKVYSIEVKALPPRHFDNFVIIDSLEEGSFTHVSPDISVCKDCLVEMFSMSDRRYLYPFINCTNCGPRYSITQNVPYDRPNTTMAAFQMCPKCKEEYGDPTNRRFHAQPNACPVCGPKVKLIVSRTAYSVPQKGNPIRTTIDFLKQGAIVAVKGLGGFHLCCDAQNVDAVRRLREKKRRSNKPFALMSPDCQTIKRFCELSKREADMLQDRRRPIVLLKKISNLSLPDVIAPRNKYIGIMLPYTPLHYLLFFYSMRLNPHKPELNLFNSAASPLLEFNKQHLEKGEDGGFGKGITEAPNQDRMVSPHFSVLVMTSGNLAEEPIVIDNEEAVARLSGIADAFLVHDRDIFMRVDDSVLRVVNGDCRVFVRRSRGYVPEAISIGHDGPDVLGCGADLKNTFTIAKGSYAIVSQHIGDMENLETLNFFEESLANLTKVYRAHPVALAHDLHPDYLSTHWALRMKADTGIQCYGIQHHYAHIASVMAEKGLRGKVVGIAFDGTGYGTDGNLWGSEFLICDLQGFTRAAHFDYVPLPGGERAIRECWRTAISYIRKAFKGDDFWDVVNSIGFIAKYGPEDVSNILKVLDNAQFSPLSSGAGRLFDAVSAIAGICDQNTFEGEAAIALESAITNGESAAKYPFDISGEDPFIIHFSPMIREIINDVRQMVNNGLIALRFHNTVIAVIEEITGRLCSHSGIKSVALSGGVFQNAYIAEKTSRVLSLMGCNVYSHERVPCNDGCISLGQAYIVREKMRMTT